MIVHDVEQGTLEWLKLRAGIPTASEFDRILTPSGKPGKQADSYMNGLIAEWIMGHPVTGPETEWMSHGKDYELQAVKAYEVLADTDTRKVGFVTTDDGMIGCSPDRLVGASKLCEIKCPKHNTHVGYMLTGAIEQDYWPQLQGQLWISERDSVDIVSYHPEMPTVIIRVDRDEAYIASLQIAVLTFVGVMIERRESLSKRFGPFRRATTPTREPDVVDWLGITDEDVDRILQGRRN